MPNPGILAICHKQDISPSSAPTRKSHPTYTHSGLRKGTYQTSKRNHFKEIRDRVCGNIEIENVYTKFVEDILTSQGPFTRKCDPIYPHFGLSQGTNKINKHNNFKEIRGCVFGNDE